MERKSDLNQIREAQSPINMLGILGVGLAVFNDRQTLNRTLRKAATLGRLDIYVGSCPDYSHQNGRYTHESLGDGVPLLTQLHLKYDETFLSLITESGIRPYLRMMIADVEANDDVFCKKFTLGDRDEFVRRCKSSMVATQRQIELSGLTGRSTSFFEEFGEDTFMETQNAYLLALRRRYEHDLKFRQKTDSDLDRRLGLYKKMYPDQYTNHEFLVFRTLRTMAQYLALGRLISNRKRPAVMIVHPTTNLTMINARNKIRLPTDDSKVSQPKIPVLIMPEKIY